MSYGVETITVHKKLKLDKRSGSENWYVRLTLDNGKRIIKSTRTDHLDEATERAFEMYYDVNARVRNKLPAMTRKFKHVSAYAIKRMEDDIAKGAGKVAYKDYISALNRWLIPFFGDLDVAKIDLAELTAFDGWRTEKNGKPFSQSGINNHNSALNRVLDEAELHGWITKSLRPTLLNKGLKSESRGSFTNDEYTTIYTALRSWHQKTQNNKASATREVLRNYVLFLANTGVRHGTEALGLHWRNIEWQEKKGERYLVVNVDGKTSKRSAIARDRVETYLDRQRKLNPNIAHDSLEALLDAKNDEYVFTTRLGDVANIFNLNRAFNALLDELDLKVGADGKARTLYSWRHYYATQDLKRGLSTHALSKQMGNSTAMLDKHYSKYSPLLNAEVHSGRKDHNSGDTKPATSEMSDFIEAAFSMLKDGVLTDEQFLAAIGVTRSGYVVTEQIAMKALEAKRDGYLSGEALIRVLNG